MQNKLKLTSWPLLCALAASGCASQQPANNPPPAYCPAPAPVAAWILNPPLDLLPMLNRLISPYDKPSTGSVGN